MGAHTTHLRLFSTGVTAGCIFMLFTVITTIVVIGVDLPLEPTLFVLGTVLALTPRLVDDVLRSRGQSTVDLQLFDVGVVAAVLGPAYVVVSFLALYGVNFPVWLRVFIMYGLPVLAVAATVVLMNHHHRTSRQLA